MWHFLKHFLSARLRQIFRGVYLHSNVQVWRQNICLHKYFRTLESIVRDVHLERLLVTCRHFEKIELLLNIFRSLQERDQFNWAQFRWLSFRRSMNNRLTLSRFPVRCVINTTKFSLVRLWEDYIERFCVNWEWQMAKLNIRLPVFSFETGNRI